MNTEQDTINFRRIQQFTTLNIKKLFYSLEHNKRLSQI